jgi:hypothetical protein
MSLSGRERAEGFPLRCADAVAGADAVVVAVAVSDADAVAGSDTGQQESPHDNRTNKNFHARVIVVTAGIRSRSAQQSRG